MKTTRTTLVCDEITFRRIRQMMEKRKILPQSKLAPTPKCPKRNLNNGLPSMSVSPLCAKHSQVLNPSSRFRPMAAGHITFGEEMTENILGNDLLIPLAKNIEDTKTKAIKIKKAIVF